ncbi:hypothetical protein GGX14DRAFT_553527 [Mycena pura]|uniref:Uncharacterized protein n=1 Tax=Mycena pura TaxID=153505 RepID=A0AAD7E5I7_9AGAR|nr:hypothetical protein GGX14DRAFT_553527 [Mycena pura]
MSSLPTLPAGDPHREPDDLRTDEVPRVEGPSMISRNPSAAELGAPSAASKISLQQRPRGPTPCIRLPRRCARRPRGASLRRAGSRIGCRPASQLPRCLHPISAAPQPHMAISVVPLHLFRSGLLPWRASHCCFSATDTRSRARAGPVHLSRRLRCPQILTPITSVAHQSWLEAITARSRIRSTHANSLRTQLLVGRENEAGLDLRP